METKLLLNYLKILIVILFFSCKFADPESGTLSDKNPNTDNNGNNSGTGVLNEVYLFPKDIWGEWIRMDTGDIWYFANNYRTVGNSVFITDIVWSRQSPNVIRVDGNTPYFLYASRVRTSKFDASAVSDSSSRVAISRAVNVPKGTNAIIKAIKNGVDKQTVEIGDNGEIEAENIIAGDDYIVTIENQEFTVTPNTDGDNVGTLTLTQGVNIKTSIRSSSDMMRFYSGESYNLTISFTNIGSVNSTAMGYRFTLPQGLEITANSNSPTRLTAGDLQSFTPGRTQDINITIKCGPVVNDFEFKDIIIDTEDFYGKKWTDSVSVRVNREKTVFNIRSNLAINGVIIVPNGKAYYFRTSGSGNLFSSSVTVPKYINDYLVVFSGASATTEPKYSFAVDRIPASNFNDFGITDLNKYWPNGTEGQAALINYKQEVIAYLLMNQANFYKVRFTD